MLAERRRRHAPHFRCGSLSSLVSSRLAPTPKTQPSSNARPWTPSRRARSGCRAEKYEEAAAEFQKAVAIYPSFVLAHYGLGQSHMALKHYDDAVTAFSAARDAYYKLASLKV